MSTTVTSTAEPAHGHCRCGGGCSPPSFRWTKTMPDNGRPGEDTFGRYVNRPIRVFDVRVIRGGDGRGLYRGRGSRAQDGSSLGRVYVSRLEGNVRFTKFGADDRGPQVSRPVATHDPRDAREPVDRA